MAAELPEFNPRYIAFSYCHTHDDGRVSYPLIFIYYCPSGWWQKKKKIRRHR